MAADEGNNRPAAEWIVEIQIKLGCINHNRVKTGSICRVPPKIEAEATYRKGYTTNYRSQLVAMGPFHRATTTSDLFTMEEIKWHFMDNLLSRPTNNNLLLKTVQNCGETIKRIGDLLRQSYREKLEMGSEELAKMMLLDASFFLEFLLRLIENNNDGPLMDDNKKIVRVLTDLMLLENQIPFFLLTVLSSKLLSLHKDSAYQKLSDEAAHLSPQKLAKLLLGFSVPDACDFSDGVCHFLHLIHLCSPDPYAHIQQAIHKAHVPLRRCARKLQSFGITIKTRQTNHSQGNHETQVMRPALREFADQFDFEIEIKQRELIIPTLHIKEATEVKWRNLIAWEQCGLSGVGYKFTSYAYFFKGLVSSCHDIQLLIEKGVIEVHKRVSNEDLLIMFQSITAGAEKMDGRYIEICGNLNKANVNGGAGCCEYMLRMPGHYGMTCSEQCARNWRRFLQWLPYALKSMLLSFKQIYLSTPWKFIGVLAGAALLGLTITQTIYAIRAVK